MKRIKVQFFFVSLALSPSLWKVVFNFQDAFSEWKSIPSLVSTKLNSIYAIYNIRYILELRNGDFLGRVFFNKITLFVNDISGVLSIASPKTFFSGVLVSEKFELIPLFLLPFWFIGIWLLIKSRNYKSFIFLMASSLFVYLTDRVNPFFLFLPSLVYCYIIGLGMQKIYEKL